MEQINTIIEKLTQENKHESSYTVGDHVIAQFTEDDNYYRARIEEYSTSTELYKVYFLDYGNIDENVPKDHLYSYSDELKKFEPQARGYLLNNIELDTWNEITRSLIEEKLNTIVDFDVIDDGKSIINLKLDYENTDTEQTNTITANISAIDKDCFYIHILPNDNLHVCEIEENLLSCNKEHKDTWSIKDLCMVSNEDNHYYRGEILHIDEKKYDVKCIDYGNVLNNVTDDHLFVLPEDEVFKQSPLARQCRFYGIVGDKQTQEIEDKLKNIHLTERVEISIENDRNDPCLFVRLTRENDKNLNDEYVSDNITENDNKQESDNIEKISDVPILNTSELKTEQDVPKTEEMNSSLSITNNQTIDFGENDPSTTVKDETNNSISSN